MDCIIKLHSQCILYMNSFTLLTLYILDPYRLLAETSDSHKYVCVHRLLIDNSTSFSSILFLHRPLWVESCNIASRCAFSGPLLGMSTV